MARFNDIPQELIDKIIYLTVSDDYEREWGSDPSQDGPGWRQGLALVASNWVDAGQRALVSSIKPNPLPRIYRQLPAEPNSAYFEEPLVRLVKAVALRSLRTSTPLKIGHLTLEEIREKEIRSILEHPMISISSLKVAGCYKFP